MFQRPFKQSVLLCPLINYVSLVSLITNICYLLSGNAFFTYAHNCNLPIEKLFSWKATKRELELFINSRSGCALRVQNVRKRFNHMFAPSNQIKINCFHVQTFKFSTVVLQKDTVTKQLLSFKVKLKIH